MNEEKKTAFFPGAEVAIVKGWGRGFFSIERVNVAKLYKNGNFTLFGKDSQWRPVGDYAVKAGPYHGWDHPTVRPITPALLELERVANLAQRARLATSAIDAIPSDKFTEEAIADLERIAKEATR